MGIPFDDKQIRLCLLAFFHGFSLAMLENDAPQYDCYGRMPETEL